MWVLIGRGLDHNDHGLSFSILCSILRILSSKPVLMAVRFHLFPSRTQKLSSPVSKILGWRRPGKIERRRYSQNPKSSFYTGFLVYIPPMADKVRHGLELRRNEYSSLAQSVERSAVNRNVVGSSPTGGAILKPCQKLFCFPTGFCEFCIFD